MARTEGKPLVWLHGEVKTPPFSAAGRIEAGRLLEDPAASHPNVPATPATLRSVAIEGVNDGRKAEETTRSGRLEVRELR